jgi:hypothetical protein
MPLTYDQITAITRAKWIPKLQDNIFDTDPIVQRARKKFLKKVNGGTDIRTPLNYATNGAGGWYSGADTFSTTDSENMTAATWDWKQLYENISITGRDKMINSGDEAILDFVKSKMQIAEQTMADRLGDAFYSTGSDANSILGLATLVDATDTVGGISGTTYSWWAAQENSSTTTLSMSALQTQHTVLTKNNKGPTVAIGTRTVYNNYYGLLQPQQRFQDGETAKGGFTSLMFNGIPFIPGSKVPTNHLFLLNEEFLQFVVHSERDMKFTGWKEPIAQDVSVAQLLFMGALAVTNRRMQGKFTALAA